MNAYTPDIQPDPQGPRAMTAEDRMIGANLRRLRIDAGVTQEQLSEHFGVTFQQVQKYERGQNRLSAARALSAARFLRVDLTALFDGCEDAPAKPAPRRPEPTPRLARQLARAGELPDAHQRVVADLIAAVLDGEG